MQHFTVIVLLVGLVTTAGCSTEGLPGLTKVTGQVTIGGKPVEGATVSFQPEGSARSASGRTDAKGNYSLTTLNPGDGAVAGSYKVMISKVEDTDPDHQVTAEEMMARVSGGGRAPSGPPRGPKKANVGLVYHVPEKYMKAETSGLTATVDASGKNHFVFELQ